MIKKSGSGYKATSESGRALSKKPKSKSDAIKQLYAVEMSKQKKLKRKLKRKKKNANKAVRAALAKLGR